jgi:hypothetical protein
LGFVGKGRFLQAAAEEDGEEGGDESLELDDTSAAIACS